MSSRSRRIVTLLVLLTASMDVAFAQTPALSFAHRFGDTGNDNGREIAIDSNGDILVAGSFGATVDFDAGVGVMALTASARDGFVARYDAAGNHLWSFDLGDVGDDYVRAIRVDATGAVVVVGLLAASSDVDPGPGISMLAAGEFIAKYSPTGTYLWAFRLPVSQITSLAVDASGNVAICGGFTTTVDFNPGPGTASIAGAPTDGFIATYTSSGGYSWAFAIKAVAKSKTATTRAARGVAFDGSGNVLVTGAFGGKASFSASGSLQLTATTTSDGYVAKYSSSGASLWAFRVAAAGGNAIAVDAGGGVVVTGALTGTADFNPGSGVATLSPTGSSDIYLAKYTAAGAYLWGHNIGGTGQSQFEERGMFLAVDGVGDIVARGAFTGTADFDPGSGTMSLTSNNTLGSGASAFTAKYTSGGAVAWAIATDAASPGNAAVGPNATVAITGAFARPVDFDPGSGSTVLTPAGSNTLGDNDIYIAVYAEQSLLKTVRDPFDAHQTRVSIRPALD